LPGGVCLHGALFQQQHAHFSTTAALPAQKERLNEIMAGIRIAGLFRD
jgi:hypothetical protein